MKNSGKREGKKIEFNFSPSQKKNLISRKMHKMLNNKIEAEAKSQAMHAMEEFAIYLKNRGIKELNGANYTLKLI